MVIQGDTGQNIILRSVGNQDEYSITQIVSNSTYEMLALVRLYTVGYYLNSKHMSACQLKCYNIMKRK